MRSGIVHFKIRNLSLLLLISSLLLAMDVFATKVTVNPDEGQISDYKSLDLCLKNISTDVDTIILTKDSAYREVIKDYNDRSFGTIYIISNSTNPDKFPVIVNNSNDFYNFFNKNNVYFERLTFSGSKNFANGATDSVISFKQCVIKDYKSTFFQFTGNKSSDINFENCLFANNSDTLFHIHYWDNSSPNLKIRNCTFDSCKILFYLKNPVVDNLSIKNCIFSNITQISNATLSDKISNSINEDPIFKIATSRTKPSDWTLQYSSPALNKVDSSDAPLVDIANQKRNVWRMSDIGCWELQNQKPTSITLTKTNVEEKVPDSTVIGILKTSDPDIIDKKFTYVLAGGTDSSNFFIVNDSLKIKKSPDFETKNSYSIEVRSTDGAGESITEPFVIIVSNVNENPTNITLSKDTIVERQKEPVVGLLIATDPDKNQSHTFTLVVGDSSTNNYLFEIEQNKLQIKKDSIITYPKDGLLFVRIQAKDDSGATFQKAFAINVLKLPVITKDPENDTVLAGDSAIFTIASDATTFQWFRNGVLIPGATTSTLIRRDVTQADSGSFFLCEVSNNAGIITSKSAMLIVNTPATILTEPSSQPVAEGDTCKLTVVATGSNVLRYSWFRNDTLITQNTPTIYIPNVTIKTDNGAVYKCVVSNEFGTDTSAKVILSVIKAKPVVTVEPVDINILEFQNAAFVVKATGSQPIQYAWFSSLSPTTPLSVKDTFVLSNVSKSDSGKTYFCIVSNEAGSDTSKYVQLHVGAVKPIITLQPSAVTIYEKTNAQFSVQTTGSLPLHYEWHKKSVAKDSVIGADNDTLTLVNVPLNDSGTFYYCIVSNVAGSDTSKEAILNVAKGLSQPIVVVQPDTLIIRYVGDSVVFKVSAVANPIPQYQWYKNDNIIAGKIDTVLTIKNLLLTDNGSKFYCVITNSLGFVKSLTATLLVEPRPKAGFKSSVISGALPLTIAFTDTSIGTITSRTWYFGDGTTDVTANPIHIYSKAGLYSVKLIVSGPGGVDSVIQKDLIYAYTEGSNPVRIMAQFLKPSSVIVTFSNLLNVDVKLPLPIADSLGLWYKKDSLPVSPLSSTRLKTYPSTIFKNAVFVDTIPLPPTDSVYGLMSGIIWQDKTISNFTTANGCFALMRDTAAPVNPITISGDHYKGDTVIFTLGNILAADTTILDSLALWYGLDPLLVNFNAPPTIWYSLKELRRLNMNQITFKVQNTIFADSVKINYALICKGINKKTSLPLAGFFMTKAAIANPITLSVKEVSSGKIVLTWPLITDTTFSKIFIWKGLKEVPIGTAISEIEYDSVQISAKESSCIFTGLNANTTYFFGAGLLKKDGTKVGVTENSRISVITLPPKSDTLPNKIILSKLEFDSISNVINVSWCLDMSSRDSMLIGITYSTDGIHNVNAIQKVEATESCGITAVKIPSLLFDTKYEIALWLSKSGSGVWTKPVSSSVKSLLTPSFSRQIVTIFEEGKKTIIAANGTIKLWTDIAIPPIVDTIKAHIITKPYSGFQVANKGFYFAKKENTLPFNIGLTYPANIKSSQVRMYREINGVPHVVFDSKTDTLNRIISTFTADLQYPFMLLIDTVKPVFTIKENDSLVKLSQIIVDSFSIKDNTGNVKWICQYSRGDGTYTASESGYFGVSDPKKGILITNPNIINEENGVRIHFIIDDGVYQDTINCSRSSFRTNSDVKTTIPNQWFPLFVTANLSHNQPESVLVNIKENDSLYDNRYARLFRWCSTKENPQDGWVEYSQATSQLFTFTPGKLIWIKTLNSKTIDFGAGITLSLKDTFAIKLPPLTWTDFGLPYRFDMRLNDILKSTKNSDSLRIFKWVKGSNGQYKATIFYFSQYVDALYHDRNVKVTYEDGYYSIYNPRTDTVTLKFPPLPYILSPVTKTLSKKVDKFWSVKISGKDDKGTDLQDIHYGYSAGMKEAYYPAAPSFAKNKISLFDRESNKMHGFFVIGKINDGGFAKEIALQNNSDSRTVFTYSSEHSGDFPSNFKTVFYNPVTKTFEESGSVTIEPHSTEYRWVITSNSAYLKDFFSKNIALTYSLGVLYPNPCRSVLVIPYTIPLGSKDHLRFEIFDQLGRLIWKKEIRGLQSAGNHQIVWNAKGNNGKRISSGLYLLRFTTVDDKNKITSRFTNRFTLLP